MNQASSLGEALKDAPVTHIVCSDLKRAHRTASAVAKHHADIAVVPNKLFREQDLGGLEGKPWRRSWTSNSTDSHAQHDKVDTGESKAAMKERAANAWAWLLQHTGVYEQETDLFVVVVSHGLFLGTLFGTICTFYGPTKPSSVFWGNTAYLKFTVNNARDPPFRIENINETSHLTAVQRQKGGVGSSKYDEAQKTMRDFFVPSPKKPKKESGKSSISVPFTLLI
jgi:broad specificity phosphatase PhoE